MKIAVCDRDAAVRLNLSKIIDRRLSAYKTGEVFEFEDLADLLCEIIEGEQFDIIFTDIQMSRCVGIETARRIRQLLPDALTIFVSSQKSKVFDCFDAHPYHFITKPVDPSKFTFILDDAIKDVLYSRQYKFTFRTDSNKLYRVDFSRILYFEIYGKKSTVFLTDGQSYEFYQPISDIEEETKDFGFIRTHKSYIVNKNCVKCLENEFVILDNGKRVPVSQRRHRDVLLSLMPKLLEETEEVAT